jgi:hypothetical protein
MRTSMVAVGWVLDLDFKGWERFGAKAEQRRDEILEADQVVVILSGNSLRMSDALADVVMAGQLNDKGGMGYVRTLHHEHIVLLSQSKRHTALHQFFLSRFPKSICITYCEYISPSSLWLHPHPTTKKIGEHTTTQTQNLYVVPQPRIRKRQHAGCKKHGLVIWMRDQQANALIPQFRESRARDGDRVEPGGDGEDGDRGQREPLHCCQRARFLLLFGDILLKRKGGSNGMGSRRT